MRGGNGFYILRTGQRLQKSHQIVELRIGQIQGPDAAAEKIVDLGAGRRHAAIVIVADHLFQGFLAAVMHIRRSQRDTP